MSIVEKLLAEEKEAEEQMYGKEPAEEQAQATEEESAPEEESTESTEETAKPKRENWKKRYIGYKTATDETIRGLRESVSEKEFRITELDTRLTAMQNELTELNTSIPPKDPFEGVFTEEDKNLLGEEALAAMKKAALATKGETPEPKVDPEVAQLKRELSEWKRREAEKAESDRKNLHDKHMEDLRTKLARIVPTFEQLDEDPKFGEYLNDIDDLSGQIRFELFEKAVNSYDVANVARFYNEYAQSIGQRESFIDDYITPEGDGATQDSPERNAKRRYHISEYIDFMDDVAKGRYRGREKEAQKLELMYDKAHADGRVYE